MPAPQLPDPTPTRSLVYRLIQLRASLLEVARTCEWRTGPGWADAARLAYQLAAQVQATTRLEA